MVCTVCIVHTVCTVCTMSIMVFLLTVITGLDQVKGCHRGNIHVRFSGCQQTMIHTPHHTGNHTHSQLKTG